MCMTYDKHPSPYYVHYIISINVLFRWFESDESRVIDENKITIATVFVL